MAARTWLILSYRAKIDGSACAQHIDDRLPHLARQGIVPVLLTGPVGGRHQDFPHYCTWSIAPSGIRFEVRHALRKRLRRRWQFKLAETLLLLPVLPFYLLEKLLINLESEWSWFLLATLRGYFLCRRYQPEVIYSTGGTAAAHVAGGLLRRWTGLPWLAEVQDPLVHDQGWRRGRRVLWVYQHLEHWICTRADAFIFLTRAARDNMAARTGLTGRGQVIYPGADPALFPPSRYQQGPRCRFAHFGTLGGTRNLMVFFRALRRLIDQGRLDPDLVRVETYGSLDAGSKKVMAGCGLAALVTDHGPVPRKQALRAMQETDCLLLVQDTIFFSSETIPSKVYEYLLTGRPILGLVHHNEELAAMLAEAGHFPAPADESEAVAGTVAQIIDGFQAGALVGPRMPSPLTVAAAVDQLLALAGTVHGGRKAPAHGRGEESTSGGRTHG